MFVLASLCLGLVGLQFHLELWMHVEDAVDDLLQIVLVLGIDIDGEIVDLYDVSHLFQIVFCVGQYDRNGHQCGRFNLDAEVGHPVVEQHVIAIQFLLKL